MNYLSENTNLSVQEKTECYKANEDYLELLKVYGIHATLVEFHWQIGTNNRSQGWIIHVSSVISQAEAMLHVAIPFLYSEKIAFRIPIDKEAYRNILNGFLGTAQIGKLISIFPDNEDQALLVAQKLIKLTKEFRGPAIPTDILLGNVVYTRYGSFNAKKSLTASGTEEKYIKDFKGNIVIDEYYIPAKLPQGVPWPFGKITVPKIPSPKKILNNFYKPLITLKEDARGNVYKGLYMKNLLRVSPCVIKQGKMGMASEDTGRDISDRLRWQQVLHTRLYGKIPLPKCIDYFEEDGDAYFVIEHIQGGSLFDFLKGVNFNIQTFSSLDISDRVAILGYLNSVLNIIEEFHQQGYVHRDIAPGNFMITQNNNICLIDIELAYCIKDTHPMPPFSLGTYGFMSPEQEAVQRPSVKEDIYALGALMALVFTGLSPAKFNTRDVKELSTNLHCFISDADIVQILVACMDQDPAYRPDIKSIRESLHTYKIKLSAPSTSTGENRKIEDSKDRTLHAVIQNALNGLSAPPMVMLNELWYSKTKLSDRFDTPMQKEFSKYPGLADGLAGINYLLARARNCGHSIEHALPSYRKSWEFINNYSYSIDPGFLSGLYIGGAGIAVAMVEGMKSGLIQNNDADFKKLTFYLEMSNSDLSLATGVAGQGVAILQCQGYLNESYTTKRFKEILDLLLSKQKKDGSWPTSDEKAGQENDLSFAVGNPGLIWFLLEYCRHVHDERVITTAKKGLKYLLRKTNTLQDLLEKGVFKQKTLKGREMGDERTGIIKTLIKAFETLGQPEYRIQAETILASYPPNIVNNNFTQETGLAGLGEVYLEAWRVFGDIEWKKRADWICRVFIHTFFKNSDTSGFWKMEETNEPMADLMTGNSGIIHFLLRCNSPGQIGFRILN